WLLARLEQRADRRGTALAYRTLAAVQLQAGAAEAAIAALTAALARRRSDSPPIEELLLALAHHRLGQHDQARQSRARARRWRRGARPECHDPFPRVELALLFARAENLVRGDTRYAVVPTRLGRALDDRGQPEQAIRWHREALRIDPRLAVAHTNL